MSGGAKLRSRLADIEHQIVALRAQLALLQSHRKDILERLDGIVYPVLTLPNEVTAKIFLQYASGDPTSTCSPMVLASVCSKWREVAISEPHLWTSFGPELQHREPFFQIDSAFHESGLLRMCLSRAGALPLNLRVHLPNLKLPESDETESEETKSEETECNEIFGLLGEYSAQLQSLHLFSAGAIPISVDKLGPLPSLTKLSLSTNYQDVSISAPLHAPRLYEATLSRIAFLEWRDLLPWSQLTILRFFHPILDECLSILEHTHNLQLLEFTDDSPERPITPAPCTLHHLHTLILGWNFGHVIVPHLTLPALRELRVDVPMGRCGRVIRDLISRSGCAPTTISFSAGERGNLDSVDAVKACLRFIPAVRILDLNCLGAKGQNVRRLLDHITSNSSLLPALASLELYNCEASLLFVLVETLAESRKKGHLAQLTSFGITFRHKDSGDTNQRMELLLNRLRNLRSGGLDVKIQPTFKALNEDLISNMT